MEENNKILEECEKINYIFKDKNPKEPVTYEDFYNVVQSLSDIIAYVIQGRNENITKIYEDMFKLHGYDENGKRLDK